MIHYETDVWKGKKSMCYETPKIELIKLQKNDVITVSISPTNPTDPSVPDPYSY